MNITDCPVPFARDQLLIYSLACDTNAAGFAVWFALLTLAKGVSGTGLAMDWWMRYGRRGQRHRIGPSPSLTSGRTRLPIVPTLNIFQFLLFLSFLVTTLADACSSTNGCPLAMYSTMYVMFGGYGLFLLKRFIHLGRRMIPLARTKVGLVVAANSSSTDSDSARPQIGLAMGSNTDSVSAFDALAKEDTALLGLNYWQVACTVVQWILGTPVQLVMPRDQFDFWLRLTFGFQAGFFLGNMLGFLVQLQRLIHATTTGCLKPFRADVKAALNKMRRTQVAYTVGHCGAITITLLIATGAIPPHWFMLLLLCSIETGASTFAFVTFVVARLRKKSARGPARAEVMSVKAHNASVTGFEATSVLRPELEAPSTYE